MRGFAICSLMARRVAVSASLSFLEFLLAMLDDGILPDLRTVNPVHTGWNTYGYGCRRQNHSGRDFRTSQGSVLAKIDQQQLPCELGPFPT
jgi:hypothetical protein